MPKEPPKPFPALAIISDIHANLPALLAVMDDIAQHNVDRIVCLGDVVGYGPDPDECWKTVSQKCDIVILGNHDHALGSGDMTRFHPRARNAIVWTKKHLLQNADGNDVIQTIANLPRKAEEGDLLFVHGSPSGPTLDYLLPGDSFDKQRMNREFALVERFAFNGHSHIPGVIQRGQRFMPPEALPGYQYQLGDRQAIINVGSVGQPRDGNPKACYITIENNTVHYHRVQYDAEDVCKRILKISQLDPFLGQRLLAGY